MSRCTTSVFGFASDQALDGVERTSRVGNRLAALATWPHQHHRSSVYATTDGVVRSPSLFSITRTLSPSMIATQELGRAQVYTDDFRHVLLPQSSSIWSISNVRNGVNRGFFKPRRPACPGPRPGGPSHHHHGRTQ